jgi:hypothetical protein
MSKTKETILTINNVHIAECGMPPRLRSGGDNYTCYFENFYGEQVVIQFDRNTKTCRMWMGDVGWEEELRIEEFRGSPIVRFARSREERAREFKMNRQFDHGELFKPDPERDEEIRRALYAAYRKIWGKPRLTDEECEYLAHSPILNQGEMRVIAALWEMWTR